MKNGALINMILVALLAVGCGVASFFAFPQAQNQVQQGWSFEEGFVWDTALESEQTVTARLNGRDSVSLLPNSTALFHWDEATAHVTIELTEGSVFFSALAGDFSASVETPFARVDSQNSLAYVTLNTEGDTLEAYGVKHPSLVTFVKDDKDLNALLVPTSTRMKISSAKVTSTLARLRLTKLTKEFQIFPFNEKELPVDVVRVIAGNERAYSDASLATLDEIQSNSNFGPAVRGLGGFLTRSYDFSRGLLTVLPSAQARLDEHEKEKALIYATTNLLFGDSVLGREWINTWKAADQDLESVKVLYRDLFFVLPGDELYPVKAAAAELLYPEEDPLTALRDGFREIEDLLESGSNVEAQSAYVEYQKQFEAALQRGDFDDPKGVNAIGREYVLLELLLRSHSVFYSVDSVRLLTDLEEKILDLAGSDQDLDEERQAFVQSKIRFLDNLFTYVVDRKISVQTATSLAKDLLSEAESYLNAIRSQVAVRDYFDSKLEEFDLSIAFMNSPEFYSYDSFQEGLQAYRTKEADLADLNEYIQSLRAGEEEATTLTLEQAVQIVESALRSNSIQYSEVVSLGDNAYRLFAIEGARTAGYAFEANYDRETGILYDVVVDGIRFSTGLILENANTVIENAVNDNSELGEEPVEDPNESVPSSNESLTESVAISLVEDALEEVGLDPAGFSITVVDLKNNVFTLEGSLAQLTASFSATYDLDTGELTKVTWEYEGERYELSPLKLSEVEAKILENVEKI